MIPGEILIDEEAAPIEANAGRTAISLAVDHTGDRPVQVGSHFHFFEVNRSLRFDRTAAYGHRLNIPAGTAVRFEPGESKQVSLVPFAGARMVYGANGLVQGALDEVGQQEAAVGQVAVRGFATTEGGDTA